MCIRDSYMASLTGTTVEGILGELKGRIYYNPETDGYEVADKFIACLLYTSRCV